MFSAFPAAIDGSNSHAVQQVYQAQEQPSLQQAMRANVPPGSQQIARGQTSEDMMMDTNAQAPENTPNPGATRGNQRRPTAGLNPDIGTPVKWARHLRAASPNKRQRLSPPDGIQTAASSAMDEQQQAAMMNRRRASVQGLQAGAAAADKPSVPGQPGGVIHRILAARCCHRRPSWRPIQPQEEICKEDSL
ncbi:hypothetical protein VKS41_004124 [Umbelopsis sp. WA50703]